MKQETRKDEIIRTSEILFKEKGYSAVTMRDIAKAMGMTKIAKETGMSRPSLYKALSDGAKPQFETIMKVLRAIGGQINVKPI